jgi:hypothetical protein
VPTAHLSVWGHSLQVHSAPMLTNVRYAPKATVWPAPVQLAHAPHNPGVHRVTDTDARIQARVWILLRGQSAIVRS